MHALGEIMQLSIGLLIFNVPSLSTIALVSFLKINTLTYCLKLCIIKLSMCGQAGTKNMFMDDQPLTRSLQCNCFVLIIR